jgi:hypothetical protein
MSAQASEIHQQAVDGGNMRFTSREITAKQRVLPSSPRLDERFSKGRAMSRAWCK